MAQYFNGLHLKSEQEPVPETIKTLSEYKRNRAEAKYTAIVLLSNILPNEIIKSIIDLIKKDKYGEQEQISYFVVNRLYAKMEEGDFNEFKRIYDEEYINNEDVLNTFNYPEFGCGRVWTDYDYCTCENKDIEKVYKYTYTKECNCSGGKRYLLFIELYSLAYLFINLPCQSKRNKETKINKETQINKETKRNKETERKKKNKEKNVYQEMMDYILGSGSIDTSYTGIEY